jgi:acyl-CoA thioester hydrolase
MKIEKLSQIYEYQFTVPAIAVDQLGHVNNVQYVQWMQEMAIRHYSSLGGEDVGQALGGTWVVREHHITYKNPAFEGDEILARTWVVDFRRVRSLRRYQFIRSRDGKMLVKGETDWVFVNIDTGRPISIPAEISRIFNIEGETK